MKETSNGELEFDRYIKGKIKTLSSIKLKCNSAGFV